jgi:hypothetical protein
MKEYVMRLTALLLLCSAIAVPAQAQQNGTGITGIHIGLSSFPVTAPVTGYGPDNFVVANQAPYRDMDAARKLIASGDYVKADNLLSDVVGRTESRQARFLKGVAKLGLGDPAAARRYFEQSLYRGRNGYPGAMSGLALAEIRLGNRDAAQPLQQQLRSRRFAGSSGFSRGKGVDLRLSGAGQGV